MATNTYKTPSRKTRGNKGKRLNVKGLSDRRLQLAIGFFLIALALFTFIAFVSYLFTGKADQSVVQSIQEGSLKESGLEAQNWLGLLGAFTAHYFIFRYFGIGAFLIPPLFFLVGFKKVFRKPLYSFNRAIIFSFFFLFWAGILIGYLLLRSEGVSDWGFLSGGIGYELAVWMESLVGTGTYIILILSLLVFVIYFFNITSLITQRMQSNQASVETSSPAATFPTETISDGEVVGLEEELVDKPGPEVDEAPESIEEKPISLDIEGEKDTPEPTGQDEPGFSVEKPEPDKETDGDVEIYDPTLDLASYKYPPIELLNEYPGAKGQVTKEELEQNKDKIIETLINFKIGISTIKATIGPTVTLYEIVPDAGIKISKIKNLENDIALSLAALGIRIIAPIPGKGTIGIEVPNKNREMVSMRSVVTTEKFLKSDKELPIVLGKTISNEVFLTDLTKMPHLLIAGATGQGKSVCMNVIITSLLYKKHPSQIKFVLVDPKKVELSLFNKLERHFLAEFPGSDEPILTDTKQVVHTLNSLCLEMESRYELLKLAGTRNLKEYNTKFMQRRLNPEKSHRYLPYIVLVIDELADLMMTAGKEVEAPIARLAQLARAIGIHLIIATQRPSVNVITGLIKANFPARLSFRVTQKVDSRTILDVGGADQLVGMGDMLLSMGSDMIRLQCPFLDTPEVEKICEYVGSQRGYESAYLLPEYYGDESGEGSSVVDLSERDALFDEAARLIVTHQQGSTSLIQRKLKLGYNRAGRLIDQLEAAGIVGPFEGSKARVVLISDAYSLEQLLSSLDTK